MIYTKQEWYTPAEVAIHNEASDCWVSLNGTVRDLTSWVHEQLKVCKCIKKCTCPIKNWLCGPDCVEYCDCYKFGFQFCGGKRLARTILAYAGKDVSHWFDGDDWIQYTHPVTGTTTTYQPHGPGQHQPVVPSTRWRPFDMPWWLDSSNIVGKMTARTRPIRITNTLTGSSVTLDVCSEETIYQIMMRYLPHNAHMLSYTWRYLGRPVRYNQTLEQNGIPDERDIFEKVGLPENIHIPDLLLYYNDDLTEDPPKETYFCLEKECTHDKPEICHEDHFI